MRDQQTAIHATRLCRQGRIKRVTPGTYIAQEKEAQHAND
jgi:predicted transcriptional regulator of viral defense system